MMKLRKTQSIFEYAVLVTAVAAAFMLMNKYVFRSINARLKQIQEEVSQSNVNKIDYHVEYVSNTTPSGKNK